MYSEEYILNYRAALKNLKSVYDPSISVRHYEGVASLSVSGDRLNHLIFMEEKSSGAYCTSSKMLGVGVFLKNNFGSSFAIDNNSLSSKVMYRTLGYIFCKMVDLPTCLGPTTKMHLLFLARLANICSILRLMYMHASICDQSIVRLYYSRIFVRCQYHLPYCKKTSVVPMINIHRPSRWFFIRPNVRSSSFGPKAVSVKTCIICRHPRFSFDFGFGEGVQ